LYQSLKRATVADAGRLTDLELVGRMSQEQQVLCIVKTTSHAAKLSQAMGHDEDAFHLSARMCPAHRCAVLGKIIDRLEHGLPCRTVSTTLVEAGVDLDFPVVYRAMAGIDSVAQAAGRCNRNGKLAVGRVYVFESEHANDLSFMSEEADCGKQVFALHGDDPLSLDAIDQYFRLHFWQRQACWDKHAVLDHFKLVQDKRLPFLFDFATVAKEFKLIPDETHPVVIPYGEEGRKLCEELRRIPVLTRTLARRAQRFTVSVRRKVWFEHLGRLFDPLFDNSLAILCSPEINYSERFGLHLDCPQMEGFFG
jgi:CRISPR-associated endonuclease/helicase Cas3